jgi:hypothetical protein
MIKGILELNRQELNLMIYRMEIPLRLSNSAQQISYLFPTLIARTWGTPKYIIRIESPLDVQQAWVITLPEGLLKIGFVGVGFVHVHPSIRRKHT